MSTNEPERVGIFGGSFDPVHLGHLLVAGAAREELGLSRVFFVPAAQSPFKPERRPIPADERLRLLRLALAGQEWCEVDDQELQRGGFSFTIETLRDYVRRFPKAEVWYLIGADHVAQLPKWREAGELAALARFAVFVRPGQAAALLPPPFRGRELKGFPLGLSSSEIRARIKAGQGIQHLVPPAVAEAICNNGLYL